VVIKFWLHISEEEQLKRFEKRRDDPLKSWKLTPDDWENRRKRQAYAEAIEEMLKRTDHEAAPWDLVEAESKRYARVRVLETVISRVEDGMRGVGVEPPALGA
jgi:polyphosphate kinase 2 (PPK2 family)